MPSPYDGLAPEEWSVQTERLLAEYPVSRAELVDVVVDAWGSIFESRIGRHRLKIGQHVFPKAQIMGDFLHELVPFELEALYPGEWRRDRSGTDKDLVNIRDDYWSTEIKTSSDKGKKVFGNRSYAQPAASKKSKSGFYLTVNFESWSAAPGRRPRITVIRLGWLDHNDWIAQAAASGQQARIRPEAYAGKLSVLYAES